MIRIKNPNILRTRLKKTEEKIKSIVDRQFNGYPWYESPVQRDRIFLLLLDRRLYLDKMFLATAGEVKHFEAINAKLIKLADDMRARAAMLWDTLAEMKKMRGFDDTYEVEGILKILGGTDVEVLKLDEDNYYGSDFQLMSEVLHKMIPDNMYQAYCSYWLEADEFSSCVTTPCAEFTDSMEDGTTWTEGALCHPALSHISICHPVHDICTHHNYSIPDLLRINDFKVTVSLSIEHSSPQHHPGKPQ